MRLKYFLLATVGAVHTPFQYPVQRLFLHLPTQLFVVLSTRTTDHLQVLNECYKLRKGLGTLKRSVLQR